MRHPAIEAILDQPGVYRAVCGDVYVFIEVDDKQCVHQLTPDTKRRDGVLSRDGWNDFPLTVTREP